LAIRSEREEQGEGFAGRRVTSLALLGQKKNPEK
jgi:hypothetical protein